ncbi:MAG: hypothetical protein K1W23_05800, partial [Lachnospiraceae bacterium]
PEPGSNSHVIVLIPVPVKLASSVAFFNVTVPFQYSHIFQCFTFLKVLSLIRKDHGTRSLNNSF